MASPPSSPPLSPKPPSHSDDDKASPADSQPRPRSVDGEGFRESPQRRSNDAAEFNYGPMGGHASVVGPYSSEMAGFVRPVFRSLENLEISPKEKVPDHSGRLDSSLEPGDDDFIQEGHPFHRAIQEIERIALNEFTTWRSCAGGSRAGGRPSVGFTGIPNTSKSRKRRKTGDEEGSSEPDEDRAPSGKGKGALDKGQNTATRLSLACPYYKRDRVRHCDCLLKELTKISYVKQHLRRKHIQPLYCPSCGEVFQSQPDERSHIRERRCSTRDFQEPEGLSHDQLSELSNKVDKKLSVEQQWYSIWDIVFPGVEERPLSPYVQGPIHETLASLREFLRERGPTIIAEHLQANGEISYDTPREERDLDAMLRTVEYRLLNHFVNGFTESYSNNSDTGQGETPSSSERAGAEVYQLPGRQEVPASSQLEQTGLSSTSIEHATIDPATIDPAMFSSSVVPGQVLQTNLDWNPNTICELPRNENDSSINFIWNMGQNTSTEP